MTPYEIIALTVYILFVFGVAIKVHVERKSYTLSILVFMLFPVYVGGLFVAKMDK